MKLIVNADDFGYTPGVTRGIVRAHREGIVTAARIVRLDRGGFAEWDSFVRAAPQAGFFHLSGWKSAIEESFGHDCPYLMALSGEGVAGVLPLVHVKSRLFGSALISTGFSVHGGPVAEGDFAYQGHAAAATVWTSGSIA